MSENSPQWQCVSWAVSSCSTAAFNLMWSKICSSYSQIFWKAKKKCFNCVTGSSLQVKSSQTQEWEVALGAVAYSISSICCQMLIKVLHRCAFLSPTDWSTSGTVRLNEPKSKQERWCDGDVTKARYISIFWQVNKTSKCILMLGTSTTTVDNPHTHSTTIMLGLWCYKQQRLPP